MIRASFNINSINLIPYYYEFIDSREFTNFIRDNVIEILEIYFNSYGNLSSCKIGVYLREDIDDEFYYDWEIVLLCKNIREFKPFLNMDYDEFSEVLKLHKRDKSINNILE